jgi:hypothetical protein
VSLQFFSIEPATPLNVTLKRGAAVNGAVKVDPNNGIVLPRRFLPAVAATGYN